jgi:hypothetical protein
LAARTTSGCWPGATRSRWADGRPTVRDRSIRWRLGGAQWGPFEGGLNLRDSYNEVAPSELTDGTNFTLDERGVASKRNDCPTTAALAGSFNPAGGGDAFFYSVSLNLFICQVGTTLYKAAPGAGSWTSFNTSLDRPVCAFVDFNPELVYTHLVDGVFSYDGTTNTLRRRHPRTAASPPGRTRCSSAGPRTPPTGSSGRPSVTPTPGPGHWTRTRCERRTARR